MEKCWDEAKEGLDRAKRRELQNERLLSLVERVYQNVPHYRNKMAEAGVSPADIKSLDDLHKLPFLTKLDLRDTYPYGMFAVPMEDIVRIHASSGTTGKQTVVGYTRDDLTLWGEVMARTLSAAGVTNKSFMQVSYGYGLFTGGLGAHAGAEMIGASVIPTSVGNTKRQIQLMHDFGTTHIACTPSYILYIAETIEEMGLDIEEFKLQAGTFGAEPWTENMRREIESRLHIKAHDIYGLSEIIGPGVSFECGCQDGLHVNEDYFYPEIIDPETGRVLPEGSTGELVFTTLTKQGLPLIRYRTKDITSLTYETCKCGRTLVRMKKPHGRSDDMLIIRGVNVFPSQVEEVLLSTGETSPHYLIVVDRVNNLDTMEVQVELTDAMFSDAVKGIETLERKLAASLDSVLGIAAKVRIVEPKSLQRSEGKAVHVIDKRVIE